MPLMNGYDACKVLKKLMKEGKLKEIYIIAYSAHDSKKNEEECLKAQFDYFKVKPFTMA